MNIWFEPDLRGSGAPRPHSHPWPFTAHVLTGGYNEHRYVLREGGVDVAEAEHRPGDANELPRDLFHEVTELHDAPGRVLTLMVATAPGIRGGWGYLDPDTGHVDPAPPPSQAFSRAWRTLNPHRRTFMATTAASGRLVILASDGVIDGLPTGRLDELADDEGYRDDATVALLQPAP